jgi:carbamoyl-phosphate synthase large subunit
MPLNQNLKKVLVIGSGPIVIGQAAEFDYAGTQACRALREEGLEVVLVNSNPATIMTDQAMADHVYIEPLTLETVKRIIKKERPDSLLSTLGGQTGLNLSMELAKEGFLEEQNVTLLGAVPETIDKAEDRQMFKDTMEAIGEPVIPSQVVTTVEDALAFAKKVSYPVIVRPAFTLGGSGGGIAQNEEELAAIGANGLRQSPITQILVEKCISGWKEIEFEVMRDKNGNKITVCSMENFDPVGIHTGDSIVIAPAVTLADQEYQMLRSAALHIIEAMGIEGGCNCQFALNPNSFEYAVIEVNPRVSRSSALASKATGYPIARVAAKIAIGYTLDEIDNEVTGRTKACFEPALDYVVVKLPKWPFDKFVYAKRKLGTQMKATGEVMAIGQSFEQALLKAVRGVEISLDSLNQPGMAALTEKELTEKILAQDDERLFALFEALKRGETPEKLHEMTQIDLWFLNKLLHLKQLEDMMKDGQWGEEEYRLFKQYGYPDSAIQKISGRASLPYHNEIRYKMVDTCAAEFDAQTPYFYGVCGGEDEAGEFLKTHRSGKPVVVVFGSGPIRIGQGIEFDYASVHCVWALKEAGYEVVIVNNNPETVSTDFNTADRLYFEPLTPEDVMGVIQKEQPVGTVVAFGGQTAIKLTKFLWEQNIPILGTSYDSIDRAEDRGRFDELLEELSIKRPQGDTVFTEEEALEAANRLGYPVLMRPSYVLGGQNMIIAYSDGDIKEYMKIILSHQADNAVLIDKYLMGTELEVDAICDGEDVLIPGIMEHIERAGVHSGDSIAVYPAWNVTPKQVARLTEYSKKLALSLKTKGLINIQYVIYEDTIYVIEVNPRSSRTVPYISKVTGVPMVDLSTRIMLGEKLKDMGYGTGLYPEAPYFAAKVPVFSFEKLAGVDVHLGPEMKSTGEVLGIARTMEEALYKGLTAAGYRMEKEGGVLITVRDSDKGEIAAIAKEYAKLGFTLYATAGTGKVLSDAGLSVTIVKKIHEAEENTRTLLESGKIQYIISTSAKGRIPARDSVKIRRKAVELGIPCLTSLDTASALALCLKSRYHQYSMELVDLNHMKKERGTLKFTKMQGCGNDYIYFDCFDQVIDNPEALSVDLSRPHFGIGGDGIILICPSEIADAKMRIFNMDGSEGKMCGNGIRCVGKYLYDSGRVKKETIRVDTLSGVKTLSLSIKNGTVDSVTVDMGKAELSCGKIPAKVPGVLPDERVISYPAVIGGKEERITLVSMGNPHCVVFRDNLDDLAIEQEGKAFEFSPLFPERVNTEFVKIIDSKTIRMRVWERGSGETLACGTGACASAVASVLCGFCRKDEEITVKLQGGELKIRYTDEGVFMTGQAKTVFTGEVLV